MMEEFQGRQSSGIICFIEKFIFIFFTILSVIASVIVFTDSSDEHHYSFIFKFFIVFLTLIIFLYSFIITILIPVIEKIILPKMVKFLNYDFNCFWYLSTYRLESFLYKNFQEIDLFDDIRFEENKDKEDLSISGGIN